MGGVGWLAELQGRLASGEACVAGVLSGTSADGIDVALCEVAVEGRRVAGIRARAFETEPFPAAVGARVHALLDGGTAGPRELALLDRDLGRAFGAAARAVADRRGEALALVASHGQTVWHHDGSEASGPATMQLGDGDEVAEAAGAAVASDFRARDVAAGGEGAPLSALADAIVFAAAERPTAVLNLGGIANLTWLGAEGAEEPALSAFDVGPANALLDGLARRLAGVSFDRDGALAASAGAPPSAAAAAFEASILAHPFFAARAPKSTGRDTFGATWLAGLAAEARARDLAPAEALAAAARSIARAVARDLARFPFPPAAPLWVAGGGVHHRMLMAALEEAARRPVRSSDEVGVPPDAREALVFAVLGARAVLGEPSTSPGATGARAGRTLGKLSPPPPARAGA